VVTSAPGRVAVIGAGLAGLAAARGFVGAGAAVTVFEKARAPGGRISTRRADELAFDHGAQYFTCREPRFAEILEPLRRSGVVAPWPGRIRSLRRGRVSPLREETERLVGVPGMSALSRALAGGLEVATQCRIDAVEPSEGGWRLRPAEGEPGEPVGPFEAVVVATPAPQAMPLVEAAPSLHRAVAAVRMQPCWAALVAFATPLGAALDGAFVEASPLAWVARNNSKPERPAAECWVLHATPAWSEAHLEHEPEPVGARLVDAFAEALDRKLPAQAWLRAHRWRYASTERPLGRPFLWDANARVGVCGDWGDGGRVERAVLSGDALARAACGIE
jgi:predicted NAD/FAD-dependent oxidoreductase